jgi:hypothetical protein
MQTARFAPDLVAATIHHDQLARADRDCIERLQEIQLDQNPDGVRQNVDADAQLANGARLLVHDAVDAARVKSQRGCQATDSTANYQDAHRSTSPRDINGKPVSLPGGIVLTRGCIRFGPLFWL